MTTATQTTPALKQIAIGDLVDIIGSGIRDFRHAPQFGLVFAGMFALGGWLLFALLWRLNMPYFAYPLAMGFALIAPFAATGFYAVSEHLEQGMPLTWGSIMSAVRKAASGEIRWMAVITGFALIIWMDIAAFLLFAFTSFEVITVDTLKNLLTTPIGWFFAILGNVVGAIIAMAVFSISVVSFPMLYDRKVDFVTAMTTSVRVVTTSPQAMMVWCAMIAASMAISIATGLLGLLLTMPVIGHATWHLYRAAVPPAA